MVLHHSLISSQPISEVWSMMQNKSKICQWFRWSIVKGGMSEAWSLKLVEWLMYKMPWYFNYFMPKYKLSKLVVLLTRHPPNSPLGRHHRRCRVEGTGSGVERHPVSKRWRRWREWRRMRWTSEAETFQDALTHVLHFGHQVRLKTEK